METVVCLLCHLNVSLSGQVTPPVFLCYSVGGDDIDHEIDTWAQMKNIQSLCRGLETTGQLEVLWWVNTTRNVICSRQLKTSESK